MLQASVIRPSTSHFASPVVLVKKANKNWRLCVNQRILNHNTIKDKFLIPLIYDLLDEVHGVMLFSKLDLRSGYYQVRVAKEDIEKMVFRTYDGHYEFLVMPFSFMNAPPIFQNIMNDVFRPSLRKFVFVFFDSILVDNKEWEEHLSHLQ